VRKNSRGRVSNPGWDLEGAEPAYTPSSPICPAVPDLRVTTVTSHNTQVTIRSQRQCKRVGYFLIRKSPIPSPIQLQLLDDHPISKLDCQSTIMG